MVSFKWYTLEEACQRMANVGYTGVEFFKPLLSTVKTPELVKQLTAYCKRLGLEPCTLNGVDDDRFAPFDPNNGFERSLQILKESIDLAHDLSVRSLLGIEGIRPRGNNQTDKELLKIATDLFDETTKYGRKRNVRIIVEPHPFSLGMDTDFMVKMCDSLDDKYFGVLYDCCHFGVGKPKGYIKAIKTLGERIKYIHFSDSDQRTSELHYPLGMGQLDIEGIVQAFEEIEYSGEISLDTWSYPLPEEATRIGLPILKSTMERLGLK